MYAVILNSQGGDKEEFWRKMYGYCESQENAVKRANEIIQNQVQSYTEDYDGFSMKERDLIDGTKFWRWNVDLQTYKNNEIIHAHELTVKSPRGSTWSIKTVIVVSMQNLDDASIEKEY